MVIQHKQVGTKGLFFIESEGNKVAEMVYSMPSPDKMIIEHTEVNQELRGRNIGYGLVQAAADYARKNNIKIVPLCPFVNALFKKKPEFADVLFTR